MTHVNKVLLAVMGFPIEHSRSPAIHKFFARQFGFNIHFEKIAVTESSFVTALNDFHKRRGTGINITMPLKYIAANQCTELSEIAKKTNVVSHLWWNKENKLCGANTDGFGMIRDIEQNLHYPITHKNILIAGAGGAAGGVLLPLLEKKPASITIASRRSEQSCQLLKRLNLTQSCCACNFNQLQHQSFDLIINATPTSLGNSIPPLPTAILASSECCYDMVYQKDQETAFIKVAKQVGVQKTADGLGMLIEHNACVFDHWFGKKPDTQPAIEKFCLTQHAKQ